MPLYEYACDVCGRFERIVKFSDPPLAACPTCNGTVQKLFSSPAIQFKGSGFYITDYPKKSAADSPNGKSSPDGSSPDKSSSEKTGKSEKSPAEKSSSDKVSGEKSSGEKSSSEKSSSGASSTSTPPAAARTTSKD